MTSLIELANLWKPFFVLHEDEKYFPLSFQTYVKGCSLIDLKTSKKLVEYPNLTIKDLTDPSIDPRLAEFKPIKDISLNLEDTNGESYFGTPNATIPLYLFTNNIVFNGNEFIDLMYCVMFGYNEAPKSIFTGDSENHIYDLEWVTVRINLSNNSFDSAYFSAHGGGGWYDKSTVTFKDGHPVSFVSIGSHAMWPTGGKHIRMLGFGNDMCSSKPETEWLTFNTTVVLLTSYKQNPFPPPGYEYMAFVGFLSQDVPSNSITYDDKKLNSLAYKPYKALEISGAFLQSKVNFDIKKVITIMIILLFIIIFTIQFFVMRNDFSKKNVMIQFLIFILTVLLGLLTGYLRLFLYK